MSDMVTDYNANEVDLIVGLLPIDSGLADGDFVRIEPASDDYTDKVGADGSVARSKSNDERADITIIVMQNSPGHRSLTALRAAGLLVPNGGGIVPFLLRDKSGAMLYAAENCWIKKGAGATYGVEAGTREWVLRVAHLKAAPDPSQGGIVSLVPGL